MPTQPEEENPIIAKLREMMMASHPTLSADVNDANAATTVEPSTETVKTMADGGDVQEPSGDDKLQAVREALKKAAEENRPAPQRDMQIDLAKPDLDAKNQSMKGVFMTKRFSEGGVAASNDNAPHKAPEGPSADEKRELVLKALREKTLKLDDGGVIDPNAAIPVDTSPTGKLQAILKAMGVAGGNLMSSPAAKVAGALTDPVGTMTGLVNSEPVKNLMGKEADAIAPTVQSLAGSPPAPSMPPVAAPPIPSAPTPPPPMPHAPTAPVAQEPDPLAQLGKFDANAATPGLNPADRQALANNLGQNQHTFGNYLAEAVAGLGDAVAAKGGVKQNSLGAIFALQTQQRQEALENFDKARQAAVEHFTMKNQADQALISNLKARGELSVSPSIARALGHPELANRPVSHADLVLKTDAMKYDFANKMQERKQGALKNAADEIDKAVAHGGIGGTQKTMDPQSRLRMIHTQAIKNDPEAFGYHVTEGK